MSSFKSNENIHKKEDVASVSTAAGCGVFIVSICVYAKSLFVYMPVCNCINWVTICFCCVCVCVCVYARCIVIIADV